jgi:hypothetical protein
MSFMIIFAVGYAIGCVSALLVVGLTLAARRGNIDLRPIDMVSHDVEHYSL